MKQSCMLQTGKINNTTETPGFTLVEVMVSVALLAIISLMVTSAMMWMFSTGDRSKADSALLESGRRMLDQISYEIKGAEGVYASTTTASQLSLETNRYLPTGETSSFVDFFLCGSALCLKKESQNPMTLTPNDVQVTAFSVTQLSNGTIPSIRIALTLQSTSGTQQATTTITSTTSLRKY